MCGFVLAANGNSPLSDTQLQSVRQVSHTIRSRGPDSNGELALAQGRLFMSHRRLSIVDTSANGHQPMQYADARYTLVFNGEIYNQRQLKAQLRALGHTFKGTSDTEVILAAYAQFGPQCVEQFRGMFAFALYDAHAHHLFLARDPFGIKPIYTRLIRRDGQNTLWVCSQVKPLVTVADVPTPASDPAGVVGFYLWGHVPEPWTLHSGIRALPAGHTALIDLRTIDSLNPDSAVASHAYFNLGDHMAQALDAARQRPIAQDDWIAWLRHVLTDSVNLHLQADVPVGVLLSGGLDSCTLAALSRQQSDELHTLTLGFREQARTIQDETGIARIMADYLQTRHRSLHIDQWDFERAFADLMSAMDQPSIDGINVYFICRAVAQSGVKVALSGIGGDELFGTYPSFRSIPRWVRYTRPFSAAGQAFRQMTAPWIGRFSSPKAASLLELGNTFEGAYLLRRGLYLPWELPDMLPADIWQPGLEALDVLGQLRASHVALPDSRHKISLMEASWYMRNQLLRDADWASMAHSVEIRLPLVDVDVWSSILPHLDMQWTRQKSDLAQVPAIRLPHAIAARRKTGFTVPVQQWLSGLNWDARKEKRLHINPHTKHPTDRRTDMRGGERGARNWAHHIMALQSHPAANRAPTGPTLSATATADPAVPPTQA